MILTPLREEDSAQLFEWINDRELVTLNSPFQPVEQADHDRWFNDVRAREDVAIFGIRSKDDDRLIGSCQLRGIDRERGTSELQIRIGNAAGRDRGHGTEAVSLLLQHGFENLGLRRVQLEVFATNRRAIRAYEKAGFSREGVRRGGALIDGVRVDLVLMAAERLEADSS